MTSPAARPLWQGRTLAVFGIVLFAFALRMAVASLSPVIDHVAVDFPVPAWVVGLIGTAPPVCFAIFGLLTPQLERRFGLERLTLIALGVVGIGLIARAFSPGSAVLLLATALIFAGVGVGNILMPPLVKKYFPDRIGLMTTVYTTTMAVSTFIPPLIAVPVADAAGWRTSLGMWALFAVIAIIPWVLMLARERGTPAAEADIETASARVFGRLWRIPLAWALMVGLAVSATFAYTSFAWLPTILVDISGVSPATAGVLLSLFALIGLPCSLAAPILVQRFHATRVLFSVAIATGWLGVAGLLVAPAVVPWLWVSLLGTTPLLFPMILVLLGLRTRTHQAAVALSSFVQSVGYGLAAIFPFAVGLLHDATGSWTAPLWLLAAVLAFAIPAAIVIGRPRTIEDDWERRHGTW